MFFLVLSYKGYFHSVITETDELIKVIYSVLREESMWQVFFKRHIKIKFG